MSYTLTDEQFDTLYRNVRWIRDMVTTEGFCELPDRFFLGVRAAHQLGVVKGELNNILADLHFVDKVKRDADLELKGADLALSLKRASQKKDDKVKSFIEGGIVCGPTPAFSEYPGAKDNPEVVAPLDKLKELIKDAVWNQPVDLSKSIPVEKLMIKHSRGNKD